jgi:hypothetical protein
VADPNRAPELRPGWSQNRWANMILTFIATGVVDVLLIPVVTSIPEHHPARMPLIVIVTTICVISGGIVSISGFGIGLAKKREMAAGYTTLRVVIPGVWQLDSKTGQVVRAPGPSASPTDELRNSSQSKE